MANQWVSRLKTQPVQHKHLDSVTAGKFRQWALGVCVKQSSKGIAHSIISAIDILYMDIRTGKMLVGPAEDRFIELFMVHTVKQALRLGRQD